MWTKEDVIALVGKHRQIEQNSCLPSAVEMILKIYRKIDIHCYPLQNGWGNVTNRTFSIYDGKCLQGIKFKHQFPVDRQQPKPFPWSGFYSTIDSELEAGRLVTISLASDMSTQPWSFHNFIIYQKPLSGTTDDYQLFSKRPCTDEFLWAAETKRSNGPEKPKLMELVKLMEGTDILTCEECENNYNI